MHFITDAEVYRQVRADFEIVRGEEVMRPTVSVHTDGWKGARHLSRNTEQKIRVGIALPRIAGARKPVGKRDISKQIAASRVTVIFRAEQVVAEFQVVLAPEPGKVFLQLLCMGAVTRAGIVRLRDVPDSDSEKVHSQ